MEKSTAKILLIDDDLQFIDLLRRKLEAEGYQLLTASNGVQGLRRLQEEQPHLVMLDVMMPRMDGWETCRRIRELSDVPIIMLTCMAGEYDKVRGLELGADDYVTKPFSLMELGARVRAALRRGESPRARGSLMRIDDHLIIDQKQCQVIVGGQRVGLSATEFRILSCFVDNIGRVLTRQSLLTQVWGWEYIDETEYLKVHIHNLRKKIEKDPRSPRYILTERGLGYRFQIPDGHDRF